MSPSYSPAGAAEFPNDNPDLHGGARWVCLSTQGAARALLRPSPRDAAPPPASETRLVRVTQSPLDAPVQTLSLAERFKGPLELDLNRIVLLHRVENIPPPPDFVFEPFKSSRLAEVTSSVAPAPIEPVVCRVVDTRDAGRRVARGWRVDIAPCVSIDVGATAPELEASPPAQPASTTIPQEPARRLARRRGRVAARALSPLPDSEEVSRAIYELEAAFGAPALHSSPNEGAGVGGWRANGA